MVAVPRTGNAAVNTFDELRRGREASKGGTRTLLAPPEKKWMPWKSLMSETRELIPAEETLATRLPLLPIQACFAILRRRFSHEDRGALSGSAGNLDKLLIVS